MLIPSFIANKSWRQKDLQEIQTFMKDSMNLPKNMNLLKQKFNNFLNFYEWTNEEEKKLSLKGRDKYKTLQSTIRLEIKHNFFIATLML